MERQKELLKNTIIIGIGNIFTKAISFILVPLFTLWLTPAQYGDYDLLFSYISLVVPIITLQLEQAILRYTLENSDRGEIYFKASFGLVLINSIIAILLFGYILKFQYQWSFIFCTITFAFQVLAIEHLRGKSDLQNYSIFNILCGILTMLFSYLGVKILNYSVDGLLVAFGLAYLITAILIIISQKLYNCIFPIFIDFKILKALLRYSLPLLPNALSWWITSVSDRTLIRIFLGNLSNGVYAVSTKIPTLIAVFYTIFNLAWQQSAIVSAKDEIEHRNKFYNDTFEKLFKFLFSSALVIISLTPILYQYVLGSEYKSGMHLVPLLVLGTVFLNLSQYLGGILLGNKNTKANGMTTLISAALNLIINFVLITKIGIFAAAISTLISYIVLFILRLYNLKEFFKDNKIISRSLISTIILLICSYLVLKISHLMGQLCCLVFVGIIFIYLNRKLVFGILKNLKGSRNENSNY